MLQILLPVDGSEHALHAVRFLIEKASMFKEPLKIHLLNVQHPFPGTIRGVNREAKQYHQEQGIAMLSGARKLLDAAGIKYTHHIETGDAPATIARYASELRVEQVVMGTRGHGAIAGLLLGSVATKVLHLVSVPVLLVPKPVAAIKRVRTKS